MDNLWEGFVCMGKYGNTYEGDTHQVIFDMEFLQDPTRVQTSHNDQKGLNKSRYERELTFS